MAKIKNIVFDNYILNLQDKFIKTKDGSEDAFVDMINDAFKNGNTLHVYEKESFDTSMEHTDKIIILV